MRQLMMFVALGLLLALPVIARAQDRPAEHAAETTAAKAIGEMGGHEEGAPSLIKAPKEAIITAWTTVVVFVLLVLVLKKAAWGPIVAGLAAREKKIRSDIEEAERVRRDAETTLREYNAKLAQAQADVQATLASATKQADQIAANIRAQAQKEAEETRAHAVKEIEAARDQAIQEVHAHAADLATTVASKILRRNLNSQDQQDLVNESLQQLQTLGNRA